MIRPPASTYRLQITPEFDLYSAAEVVPYLHRLGVDWVYLSPLLAAAPGSEHGYDVVDHTSVDPARGGADGLAALSGAAHAAGMWVLVDIVPNHMGVADPTANAWWWDVLAGGEGSRFAGHFDIDWAGGGGRLVLPVLGDGPDELARLTVDGDDLCYYERRFPIAAGTGGGTAQQVHDRQHYRLVDWHAAATELNYRRFFTIADLAAVRVEDPRVFDDTHVEIGRWVHDGLVDGLRIDHPDGLADPGSYLARLRELVGPDCYLVVEKILQPGEQLPADWACQGTTGYDALGEIDRLLVDPAGENRLRALDAELRGGLRVDWPAFATACKIEVAGTAMRAEVGRLERLLPGLPDARESLLELLSRFRAYRSYVPAGVDELSAAVARARAERPELGATLEQIHRRWLADPAFADRAEQTSGALTAKGVEDMAFYRWPLLCSLTEVGGDPDRFALDPSTFHVSAAQRAAAWPETMTALSTHDTKHSEDVRARIDVISERPEWWAQRLHEWQSLHPLSDAVLANLLWQNIIGAWPMSEVRIAEFAQKAAREAGLQTAWDRPDPCVEAALADFARALAGPGRLRISVAAAAAELDGPGWSNSLTAKVLQLAGPGVPDVYQGSELGRFDLVDPDNRRPTDFAAADEALSGFDRGGPLRRGTDKLGMTATVLRLRRDRPELFTGYRGLAAEGPAARHLVTIDRGGLLALAVRFPVRLAAIGGWQDTTMTLPFGRWQREPAGPAVPVSGTLPVSELLAGAPIALFTRVTP